MFTDIRDLQINTAEYLRNYVATFEKITYQKEKNREEKINYLMSQIRDNNIFKIEGDESFVNEIYTDIRKLLEVKPGRLLLKELIRHVLKLPQYLESPKENFIRIQPGRRSIRLSEKIIELNRTDEAANLYNGLIGENIGTCVRPPELGNAIILAHELIHELHARNDHLEKELLLYNASARMKTDPRCDFFKSLDFPPNPKFQGYTFSGFESQIFFENFSNQEEVHTISGVNVALYLRRGNQIEKLDILCENAFLTAFKLPPRINHLNAYPSEIVWSDSAKTSSIDYYNWLTKLIDIREAKVYKEYKFYFDS